MKALQGLSRDLLMELGVEKLAEMLLTQAAEIARLQTLEAENELLRQHIREQNERIKQLEEKLLALEQASMRQAAPFRREKKTSAEKKKSGRDKGHPGSYKAKPGKVDEQIEVKLEQCPRCLGPLTDLRPVEQYIQEIPSLTVHTTQLITYRGTCAGCGKVCSTHPLQCSQATGAASTHLGPNATALALQLCFDYGLSKRKTSRLLKQWLGLDISASGLVQLAYRLQEKLQPDYEQLQQAVKQSELVHCDETSWYVGAAGYWLWTFSTPEHTLYQVEASRGRKVVEQVLGEQYKGVLISDCYVAYEQVAEKQQKCYAHHLRAISAAGQLRQESQYLQELKQLLEQAMALKKQRALLSPEQWQQRCQQLEETADKLLRAARADEVEEKVANRLRKQRQHLFTFLHYEQVQATNNQAERMLRPAVISRKLSCGNRTEKGKQAWQCHTSLIVTHQQQQKDFCYTVRTALKNSLGEDR